MRRSHQTTRLLRALARLSKQIESKDVKLLKEMEKCPSSRTACAMLTSALNASHNARDRAEFLGPDASWIHPFV